jgi:hypothetical protein
VFAELADDGIVKALASLDLLFQVGDAFLLLLGLLGEGLLLLLEGGDALFVVGESLRGGGSTCCSTSIFFASERCSFSLLEGFCRELISN